MRESDFDTFGEMLDAVCSLLSRGAYVPSATNTAMFFRALQAHPLEAVRSAFDAHVADPQRGRFVPVPADILAQIEGQTANDGRPGAEEAWAIVLSGSDERDTIVWTAEMAEAWGIAKPVFDADDEVGARMAFREAYVRLVGDARRRGIAPAWTAALGFDVEQRERAIAKAVEVGRLRGTDLPMLSGPRVQLLELANNKSVPDYAREALSRLSEQIKARTAGPSADAVARIETQDRQGQAAQQAQAYAIASGLELPEVDRLLLADVGEIPAYCLPPAMRRAS